MNQSNQLTRNAPSSARFAAYIALGTLALATTGYVGYMLGKREESNVVSTRSGETLEERQQETIPTKQYLATPSPQPRTQKPAPPSPTPDHAGEEKELIRTIQYKPVPDWPTYISPTGYSLQYPTSLGENGPNTEFRDGTCITYVSNNAGGVMSFKVVPYQGGSRRKLFFGDNPPSTDVSYEEVRVSAVNALVIYRGEPYFDFSDFIAIVVPKGDAALIVNYPRRRNIEEWEKVLGTVQLDPSLDLSKCEPS